MSTFYDRCFEEIKAKAEENGSRTIDFDEVDRLVVERSKNLNEDEEHHGLFTYWPPPPKPKPRKTRKDKGIKKTKPDDMLKGYNDREDPEGL